MGSHHRSIITEHHQLHGKTVRVCTRRNPPNYALVRLTALNLEEKPTRLQLQLAAVNNNNDKMGVGCEPRATSRAITHFFKRSVFRAARANSHRSEREQQQLELIKVAVVVGVVCRVHRGVH